MTSRLPFVVIKARLPIRGRCRLGECVCAVSPVVSVTYTPITVHADGTQKEGSSDPHRFVCQAGSRFGRGLLLWLWLAFQRGQKTMTGRKAKRAGLQVDRGLGRKGENRPIRQPARARLQPPASDSARGRRTRLNRAAGPTRGSFSVPTAMDFHSGLLMDGRWKVPKEFPTPGSTAPWPGV